MNKLTPKQKTFCQEYLVDLNATQAAIRAKYSKKTAYSQGQRLLKNVEVKAYLQKRADEHAAKTGVTVEYVITNLQKVVEMSTQAVPVMVKEDGELVESGEYKFDSYGANKALELLGKHLGMFAEPEKGIGDINVNIAFGFGDENLQGNVPSSTNRMKRFKVDG